MLFFPSLILRLGSQGYLLPTISVHGGMDRIECGSSLSVQHGVQDLSLNFTSQLVPKDEIKLYYFNP